jgi:hypothetical protein
MIHLAIAAKEPRIVEVNSFSNYEYIRTIFVAAVPQDKDKTSLRPCRKKRRTLNNFNSQ